jgi:predicted transcriptional regulator
MKLSQAMRARMDETGWSADDVAARSSLARSTVFKLLKDADDTRTSTLRKLKKIGVRHPLLEAL